MTEKKGIRIKNIYDMLCYAYQTLWQSNYQGIQMEQLEGIVTDFFNCRVGNGRFWIVHETFV